MDSLTYWKNREAEQRNKNIKDQAAIDKEIEGIYNRTMAEVQKEIDAFYGKYAAKEGITISEAKKRASQLDMDAYSAKAKKYVAEHDLSKEANEEMRLYNLTMKVNRLELLKANIGMHMVGGFDEMEKLFGDKLTDRTLDEFKRQAGILGETIQDNNKKAASIVNASFHNATYSDRIWMHQDLLKAEIAKNLKTGLVQGKNPRVLAQDIRRTFGSSQYNAERLMRTEMARVQTDAQMQSFKENGFDEYQYLALGNACEICRALDGKHFPVDKMMPGLNAPPMHPNCRCSTSAYMGREEFDQWLDDKADTTEEERTANKTATNYAISNEIFTVDQGAEYGDLTSEEVEQELKSTEIGRHTIEYLKSTGIKPIFTFEDPEIFGVRGSQYGDTIKIYIRNIHSKRVCAQTVIHEVAHIEYGIGSCQWAEAVCFAQEKKHIANKEKLSFSELRYIVKLAKDNYPEYNWKKGGYRNGRTFRR